MHTVEFYRNAYVLVPEGSDHLTTMVGPETIRPRVFCSCSRGSYAECSHAKRLMEGYERCCRQADTEEPWVEFTHSAVRHFFCSLHRAQPLLLSSPRTSAGRDGAIVRDKQGQEVLWYDSESPQGRRLGSRLKNPSTSPFSRAGLIRRLDGFVMTANEKRLSEAGHETVRLAQERGFWGQLAYHIYRESLSATLTPHVRIDSERGAAVVDWLDGAKTLRISCTLPRNGVLESLSLLQSTLEAKPAFSIEQSPAEIFFRFRGLADQGETVTVEPVINCARTNEKPDWQPLNPSLIFGAAVYLPGPRRMVPLSFDSRKIVAARWTGPRRIARDGVSALLQENAGLFSFDTGQQPDLFSTGESQTFDRLVDMPVLTHLRALSIAPEGAAGHVIPLRITCTIGPAEVGLAELMTARRAGRRFVITGHGFVDTDTPELATLVSNAPVRKGPLPPVLSISRAELLRLKTATPADMVVVDSGETSRAVDDLLSLKPVQRLRKLKLLKSVLRPYQRKGVKWLLFLWDNYLGGILADEMGLGKTHQALGLMAALREQRRAGHPFLVVCPTTVIGHWADLAERFAPRLRVRIHHGGDREHANELDTDILLTSYGILRNDIEWLQTHAFDLAVFDEIQGLKNKYTLSARAAARINARCRIGLTGTPVENTPRDLKTLLDTVVPGYMGSDEAFEREFGAPVEGGSAHAAGRLRRRISPFVLRRIRNKVLKELPRRIEDTHRCAMTPEQAHLYRQAVLSRGASLVKQLRDPDADVPYMHIFALLGYLKQLCDHPRLVDKTDTGGTGSTAGTRGESSPDLPHETECRHAEADSGKWETAKELLGEAIDSGEKVVIYSQYLGMIDIIDRYLTDQGIDHVVLSGTTRNRGSVVRRFQNEDSCRVFVGSLKAGGVGIDLTAASVVIHYDRWWNAAAEDQATDRVHRIGQHRPVQVIKLLTKDTLEERIDAIISRKRGMAEELLPRDRPDALKSFTRKELTELLGG